MPDLKKKALIVEDNPGAGDILATLLEDHFEAVFIRGLEEFYEYIIAGQRPYIAFVDIVLGSDPKGGCRVLEILRGFSPQTVIYVVSADLDLPGLEDRLSQWPSVRGTLTKGNLNAGIVEILTIIDRLLQSNETAWPGIAAGRLFSPPYVLISEEVRRVVGPLGVNVETVAILAFPMDSSIDVMQVSLGMSGAIGLGVVVRSGVWRYQNVFYFLKVDSGGSCGLTKELDNYCRLRAGCTPSESTFLPKCYGIVRYQDLEVLIYEYVGIEVPGGGIRDWRPSHFGALFDDFLKEGFGASDDLERLSAALEPVGKLLRSSVAEKGQWLREANRGDLLGLCGRAARSSLHRLLGREGTELEVDRFLNREFLQVDDLEEIRLVSPESGKVFNPVWRLAKLEIEAGTSLLNLGAIHGDLHSQNLIFASRGGIPYWMLIDFEHVKTEYLQVLDAARLECDLLFERTPIQSIEASYQLSRHLVLDAAGYKGTPQTAVEHMLVGLHHYVVSELKYKWKLGAVSSIRRQYLYALLYESVRWLNHKGGPTRFIQRFLYGSIVCETLNRESGVLEEGVSG